MPAEGVCDRTAASRLSLGLTSDRFILNKTFRGARLLPRAAKASRCSADPEGGVKNHRTRRAPGERATLQCEARFCFLINGGCAQRLSSCHCCRPPHLDPLSLGQKPPTTGHSGTETSVSTTCSPDSMSPSPPPGGALRLAALPPGSRGNLLGHPGPWAPSGRETPIWAAQLGVSGERDGRVARTLHRLTLSSRVCVSPGQRARGGHPRVPLPRTLQPGYLSAGLLRSLPYCGQAQGPLL